MRFMSCRISCAPLSNLISANPLTSSIRRPRRKFRPDLELAELLANHEARLLQDVLRIRAIRHERVDVGKNPPLMLRHQQHELLLRRDRRLGGFAHRRGDFFFP